METKFTGLPTSLTDDLISVHDLTKRATPQVIELDIAHSLPSHFAYFLFQLRLTNLHRLQLPSLVDQISAFVLCPSFSQFFNCPIGDDFDLAHFFAIRLT